MWTETRLDDILSQPSPKLIEDIRAIEGDIMVLGAGGKMGPSLCLLAKRAIEEAGLSKRVIAVSRFSDPIARQLFERHGIETVSCDLQEPEQLRALPKAENIIFMAGRKFGTDGNEWRTWGMNATLPAFVAEAFRKSRFVVFSSGNIYPLMPLHSGGCTEETPVRPIGDYAMSCLARERAFEYAANTYGSKVFLFRLNFAVDLRYGVLFDIANRVLSGEPVSVATPLFNCIWQGSANEAAIRALRHAQAPACVMNITGPELCSVREVAQCFGKLFGKAPVFAGVEQNDAYISNASRAIACFGYPSVSLQQMIEWQAQWLLDGGRTLEKPTHFEERGGTY